MTAQKLRFRIGSKCSFSVLAKTIAQYGIAAFATLLLALNCMAITVTPNQPTPDQISNPQIPTQSEATNQPATQSAGAESDKPQVVTIPAGTTFPLVLTDPISSKTVHRGDEIHAQTTAPILVDGQSVIPPGSFIEGQLASVKREGTRADIRLTSASIVFPGGYVAKINGPLSAESDEGTAWRNPSDKAKTAAILAPLIGVGAGAGIGSAIHTSQSATLNGTTITQSTPGKGIVIGSAIGGALGGAIALGIFLHSQGFFVDVGSPMEMSLPQPLTLSENEVENSFREARDHPVPAPMAAPRPVIPNPALITNSDHGICYTPGSPGTPPTVIPGTPPIGDNPGTPTTVIPGIPPTPPTPYPCP
jgi:hypothetical protein